MGANRKRKATSAKLYGRARALLDKWDAAVDLVADQAKRRIVKGRPPWDTKEAYVKIQVYVIINNLNRSKDSIKLAKALEQRINFKEMPQTSFDSNPYRWAFKALNHNEFFDVKRHQSLKWGNELMYASLHNVPPEFLIGFISQVGGGEIITKKLAANDLEPWLTPVQRQLAAGRSLSFYPLSVLAHLE